MWCGQTMLFHRSHYAPSHCCPSSTTSTPWQSGPWIGTEGITSSAVHADREAMLPAWPRLWNTNGRHDGRRSLPPTDRPDSQRMFWGQLDVFRFMADHKTFALTQRVCHRLQTDLDLQHLPAVGQGKLQYRVVLRRAPWPEGQCPVLVPHAAKAVGEHHPGAAHRGDMAAVLHVPAHVGQIHQQGRPPVPNRLLHITDLGLDDRLDARRQRGVARGQRVVERKVPLLRLEGKRMTQQEHRQHYVRLFDHLLAVDVERMIKEQQRVVVTRCVLEVPGLAV